jgi:hypothetical protein
VHLLELVPIYRPAVEEGRYHHCLVEAVNPVAVKIQAVEVVVIRAVAQM